MLIRRKTHKIDRKARTLLEDRLDQYWRDFVRERDGRCRRCMKKPRLLEAHHIVKRRAMPTRWDPINGLATCLPCHDWAEWNPDEARFWACAALGEDVYDALVTHGRGIARYSVIDLEELATAFKAGEPISRVSEMLEGVTA